VTQGVRKTTPSQKSHRRLGLAVVTVFTALSLACAFAASSASASKQVVDYFGSSPSVQKGALGGEFSRPQDIAVNTTGAGAGNEGDIYVVDGLGAPSLPNPRVQRFAHDDNGTPADFADDSYSFISAWGADVDGASMGGTNYEICTVATQCRSGVSSGGNGTLAGNGTFSRPRGIAVDQDTGLVYVSDFLNDNVSVYDGSGVFQRSFGWDVVESGPGNTGSGYEVCVAANGDICKAGVAGAGVGQVGENPSSTNNGDRGLAITPPDGLPATGDVFLADPDNHRINIYDLDGSSPSSFGSAAVFPDSGPVTHPDQVEVDSRGIVYAPSAKDGGRIERYDSQNANGGGVGFLTPILPPPPLVRIGTIDFTIDPDSDGAGPDADVIYVLVSGAQSGEAEKRMVLQYGPINAPGLVVPPTTADDIHGDDSDLGGAVTGIALDESNGGIYVTAERGGGQVAAGVYVLNTPGAPPTAVVDSFSDITSQSVVAHGTVNPNGPPVVSYHFEYSTDGATWRSTPEVSVGVQESPQPVEALIEPPLGLEPNTLYRVRLVATKRFSVTPVVSSEKTVTTLTAPPIVETTGSPLRTATTARLDGRVNPRGSSGTYHFEYGDQGPCDSAPCTATELQATGSGGTVELVSQAVEGLHPNTTYHYRIIADNGDPAGPTFGGDMTVTTRVSDALPGHGNFPGPPGSDRAWEQVNAPDTGGNPVFAAIGISSDGNRVVYQVSGGTPDSTVGTLNNQFLSERTATGWKAASFFPPRDQAKANFWFDPIGKSDLSEFITVNSDTVGTADSEVSSWRITPGKAATKVHGVGKSSWGDFTVVSDDASRVLSLLQGESFDPAHPVSPAAVNLYDVSSGTPRLVGLLPSGGVPACGETAGSIGFPLMFDLRRSTRWVSPDGSLAFFPTRGDDCGGPVLLYVRDIPGESTKLLSTPPISGPSCSAAFIKSTPGAAFFFSQSRLVADDAAPGGCDSGGGDVYRYDLGQDSLDCVTCAAGVVDADIAASSSPSTIATEIAVAEDGSRVYFRSPNRLLPGAVSNAIYRVNVTTGNLAYVGQVGGRIGDAATTSGNNALTPDGAVVVFRSSDPSLNARGGQDNGDTAQYYRYDDRDRSLVCVSCPPDGSEPTGKVIGTGNGAMIGSQQLGPNLTPLDDAGDFVFNTPTPLVGADQNTAAAGQDPQAGTDIYEWRDGRLLLVTDGLTDWPIYQGLAQAPEVSGISPSGRDVFFTIAAQLTPDALDGYRRLYNARIGGGIEFPVPPKPCPLEVCQGTPKGAPEETPPGTSGYSGPGNVASGKKPRPRCAKSKVRRRGRCVPKPHKRHATKRANHKRRASR
jgi:hypothetical protein